MSHSSCGSLRVSTSQTRLAWGTSIINIWLNSRYKQSVCAGRLPRALGFRGWARVDRHVANPDARGAQNAETTGGAGSAAAAADGAAGAEGSGGAAAGDFSGLLVPNDSRLGMVRGV